MLEAQAGSGIGFGLPFMILGLLFLVVMLGGLVMGLVFLFQLLKRGRAERAVPKSSEALEVLKLRYARGELSREDFERMRKEIE